METLLKAPKLRCSMTMIFGPKNIVSKTVSEASENELIRVLGMEQAIVKARYSTIDGL